MTQAVNREDDWDIIQKDSLTLGTRVIEME